MSMEDKEHWFTPSAYLAVGIIIGFIICYLGFVK